MPNRVNHLLGGRYRIHTPIGSGGMGSVYQATDETLQREVAVKVYRQVPDNEPEWARQEREIRLLATLQHPGLVTIHDAGVHVFGEETRLYLVMELFSDPTLDSRIAAGTLSSYEASTIGGQIAEALGAVHAKGVVHRDVKPANILIADHSGRGFSLIAKLTDFGIAQLDGGRMTTDGTLIGTASYLSPEQARRETVTGASDIYSLGLVLLEALTGTRPFPGNAIESIAARLNSDPRMPDELAPQWRELIRRMTDRDPGRRPSAATVARVLRGRSSLLPRNDPRVASGQHIEREDTLDTTGGARAVRADLVPAGGRASARRPHRPLSAVEVTVLVVAVAAVSWLGGINTGMQLVPMPASTQVSGSADELRSRLSSIAADRGGAVDSELDAFTASVDAAQRRGQISSTEAVELRRRAADVRNG